MEERDDLFRDLCENAHDLIQSVSPEGRFIYVNRSWLSTLGYAAGEVARLNFLDVIHPDNRPHCERAMADLMKGDEVARVEADFLAKNGRRVPVEGSARCRFEGGRPVATRGIFRDVSERKRAKAELDRLFELSLDLLCVAGVDGYFKQINPAFERILGYGRQEMTSRAFFEFIHPDDQAATLAAMERLRTGLPVVDFENRYRAKDGSYRWLAWRSTPDTDGGLIYAVARDITEQKRVELLVQRQAEDLARSNADLEQFAYAASHDLHAPLRAVANLARWILEDLGQSGSESVHRYLNEMERRVLRMETLIDDLLKYARAGRGANDAVLVDTAVMIQDLVFLLSPADGFQVSIAPGMPVFSTTRAPLEQVFRNLIGNAIRHHDRPDGRVEVSARDLGAGYEFVVRDDGPGIPERFHVRVFEMFQQIQPNVEDRGSGMGLALVKRIVESQGGRVRLESGPGRGATFLFTWPKRGGPPGEEHAAHPDR